MHKDLSRFTFPKLMHKQFSYFMNGYKILLLLVLCFFSPFFFLNRLDWSEHFFVCMGCSNGGLNVVSKIIKFTRLSLLDFRVCVRVFYCKCKVFSFVIKQRSCRYPLRLLHQSLIRYTCSKVMV